ncbi:MAG: kinase [Caldilineae bacterium]|nr:MAG: kinase [Caldilineae bacterium]
MERRATTKPKRPYLIAVGGLPGSGKSVAAQMIAERLHARLLRSDVIRKELFPEPQYTPEEGRLTYQEMFRRAGEALAAGESVVLDATFYSRSSRKHTADMARQHGARWLFVLVTAPEDAIRERLARRQNDPSDANFAVYQILKQQFEPVTGPHLHLDNSGDLPALARQIDEQLDAWLD